MPILSFKGVYNLEALFNSSRRILVISYSEESIQALIRKILEDQSVGDSGKITIVRGEKSGAIHIGHGEIAQEEVYLGSELNVMDKLGEGWLLIVDDLTPFITDDMVGRFLEVLNRYERFVGGCKYPIERKLSDGFRRVVKTMDTVLFIPKEVQPEV